MSLCFVGYKPDYTACTSVDEQLSAFTFVTDFSCLSLHVLSNIESNVHKDSLEIS